ncbi:hypothetical protein AAFC00_003931 [Neodothiora populina]|uniref:Glycoside hydrolase family 79 protein n=1 Tax=Neodothiora populina TaxID=2781224 RepID=A0ABR3PG61_9PEZI
MCIGSTQDLTLFDESQEPAVIQYFAAANPDYPANETIGPAFFESYQTWPGTRFSHGFNLAYNSTSSREALLRSVPYACRALRGNLNVWELGNEPDFYAATVAGPTPARGSDWNETLYIGEWLEWPRKIHDQMRSACPDLAKSDSFQLMAPSFASNPQFSKMQVATTFADGLNTDQDISYLALHNYMGARGQPGITLQGTLMNHTNTKVKVQQLLAIFNPAQALSGSLKPNGPTIVGEGNSLARQGIGGVSNSFGAALWGAGFGLQLIANGIGRWHMHQGTNYRYQA